MMSRCRAEITGPTSRSAQRGADAQGAVARRHARHHVVEDAALDQDARRGRTGLPGVLDAGIHQEGQRGVQVGIGEDDLRALAAEFQRHRHGVLGRCGLDHRTHADRAGEGQVLHAGMRRQRRAGLFAQARHDVQRAGGQAGLVGNAREGQRRQAGFLGGLEHAGIAHGQRRADAAADDLHRVVPGHDVAGDAMRLAQRQRGVAGCEGDGLAHHLVGRAAVELQVAGQRHRIGAALLQGLPTSSASSRASSSACSSTRADMPQQHAPALGGAELAPGAVERGLRRGHGGVDVGRVAARDLRQQAAVGRVEQRQRLAAGAGPPQAGDEHAAAVEGDVGHGCNSLLARP